MLELFGLSDVIFHAMPARVTIIESPMPVNAGRADVNLFTQETNGKATSLSGRSEGDATKISRCRPIPALLEI